MDIKPKLFFDTNILIYAANGTIPADEWQRLRSHVENNFEYCLSFITMKELFSKAARGGDSFFEQNKRPLRISDEFGKCSMLPYPAVSALRPIFGDHICRKGTYHNLRDEEWSAMVLEAVLDAPSKAELKRGIPVRGSKTQMRTFDLDDFDQHENGPQNEHADLLAGLRNGTTHISEPTALAGFIARDFGIEAAPEQLARLAASLDAVMKFSESLYRLSKNKGYDFYKHANDWGDVTQLFYLCDESMHFLTWDGDFKNHASDSPQSSRILLYPEFVRSK
jgi:hypothetical protein